LRFKLPAAVTLHSSFRILSYDSSIDSVPYTERGGVFSLYFQYPFISLTSFSSLFLVF
jgi:hypothetical protein